MQGSLKGAQIINSTNNVPIATATTTKTTTGNYTVTSSKMANNKLPTGIITKPNTTGYDVIKPNMVGGQGKR